MATKYIGRDGKRLKADEWAKLHADDAYRILSRFDNGKVEAYLTWNGEIKDPVAGQHKEYWPLFILKVNNYLENGTKRIDPVENGRTFPTEEDAVAAYKEFLMNWANCHNGEGQFVERGNQLAPIIPPPPPDPNRPQTEPDMLGSEGAW